VAQSAVVVDDAGAGLERLVACFTARASVAPDATSLREFMGERLPRYMLPAGFVPLPSLPMTLSGKIDRKALLSAVAAAGVAGMHPTYEVPVDDDEQRLAALFAEVLNVGRVGRSDNFFDLGGHSLLAVRLMTRVRTAFAVDVPLVTLFARPTVAELAAAIAEQRAGGPAIDAPQAQALAGRLFTVDAGATLVPLVGSGGEQPALFLVHGLGGHLAIYAELVAALADRWRVYGLQATGLDGTQAPQTSVVEMARHYVTALRAEQPHGPYRLGGWSMGGIIALEMAQQLTAAGETVERVVLFDTHLMAPGLSRAPIGDAAVLKWIATRFDLPAAALQAVPKERQWQAVLEHGRAALGLPEHVGERELQALVEVCKAHVSAVAGYQPRPYAGPVLLFRATGPRAQRAAPRRFDSAERWHALFPALEEQQVAGNHYAIMRPPGLTEMVPRLAEALAHGDYRR
jgi:thioesterase domain-containing protein/acyl carrier protein